jgi:hypothetical protein
VLMLLNLVWLTSCATPLPVPVPVISKCPSLPQPPPELLAPPEATTALDDLQRALQEWADGAKPTPPDSNTGRSGSEHNRR